MARSNDSQLSDPETDLYEFKTSLNYKVRHHLQDWNRTSQYGIACLYSQDSQDLEGGTGGLGAHDQSQLQSESI